MAVSIDLADRESRLLQLAVFYLLGHPRWQSDRATGGRRQELLDVQAQLEARTGTLRVNTSSVALLDSALGRVLPELKTYDMLAAASAGKRDASTVEGFDEEMRRLFPESASNPDWIDDALPELVELRRDFARTARQIKSSPATEAPSGQSDAPKWQFWKRR
ncbi:MAG: hypothetical protein GEU28_05575 [Dehalococcoidia bacterium]|nr:hypothetical protein [Dehalococcoidia bacterium]